MTSAYRSREVASSETIVIPMARSRWWTLVFVLPFPLVFDDGFMQLLAPKPIFSAHPEVEYAIYESKRLFILLFAFGVAITGIVIALTSLLQAKTVIVVDRGARVLRVRTRQRTWDVAFAERPSLVDRDGKCFLHAGALTPILVASEASPAERIARLRIALGSLTS